MHKLQHSGHEDGADCNLQAAGNFSKSVMGNCHPHASKTLSGEKTLVESSVHSYPPSPLATVEKDQFSRPRARQGISSKKVMLDLACFRAIGPSEIFLTYKSGALSCFFASFFFFILPFFLPPLPRA